MANCHDLFNKFHKEIILTPSQKSSLRTARKTLRDRIKGYFMETMKEKPPIFWGQGSYAISTLINPLNGEYDIDDGVYLQNLDSDKSKWPPTETVHSWIYNAVKGHTKEDPVDKARCVRVIYSGKYHVDLPIYAMYEDKPYLAEKGEPGWHISDPRALTDWFKKEVQKKGEQLKRIVIYLKGWKDNKSKSGKLPNGLVLTVLTVNNYEKSERDDVAFAVTVRGIYNQILSSNDIRNPVDTNESLTKRISAPQMKNFKERLSTLLENASKALKEDSKEKACRMWKSEFGDKFPKCEGLEENDTPLKTSTPAIFRDDARSA